MEYDQALDPRKNYQNTRQKIGYVNRKEATEADYQRIGFKSGLEVHQQLKTQEKLFCHCPAGIYHNNEDYDAEVIRHMRPTLSELGEYDGTALMEYKTRKEIVYRLNNETACTYEIDDTPPFKMDQEALEIALDISLQCKLNIVGEVHITRKQYLDGSIPTGFQRTAIIGVEGELPLKNKTVRLIQLSLEEDSCREISDIRHTRIFKTDRLGMPLIETVTYPDMFTPDELREAAEYIRFLNRSTGKVRTGIGSGREDVNVSCRGGTRVELKGVAHNKWIPELSHNEAFRQWALLFIKDQLAGQVTQPDHWEMSHMQIDIGEQRLTDDLLQQASHRGEQIIAINLPGFRGILSHFTQPGKVFADEIEDRLKVIACLERPNMSHSEESDPRLHADTFPTLSPLLSAGPRDAQIILWGPEEDIPTALETVEERCRMAFHEVPRETRKTFPDGTTVFERVLPGPDRMYPDTDSAPIPLDKKYIEERRKQLPEEIIDRYHNLREWDVPEDTYHYIFSKDLYPLIRDISEKLGYDAKFAGTFIGHTLKFVEGHYKRHADFQYTHIYDLFAFISQKGLIKEIAKKMLPWVYNKNPMDFEQILGEIHYKPLKKDEILSRLPQLHQQFDRISHANNAHSRNDWMMGQLHHNALGNIPLDELRKEIEKTQVNP
ncbi:MAG: Glu-tRNA(Gln) amidotransferase subunit GatE [Bacteroidales bacterium]|nr:Glu-tRNA(Gln) amidotransferase subunit GatE [Bacteroidales bacterium]